MAKLPGDPNSATSEWFINLSNNSVNLDVQNSGFSVFGEVVGNGMDVIDAVNNLTLFNFGGGLTSLPLRDYTVQNQTDGVEVTDQHLVLVTAVVITDAATDTAANLSPVENTLIDQVTPSAPPPPPGGGGSTSLEFLLMLGLLYFIRRRANLAS